MGDLGTRLYEYLGMFGQEIRYLKEQYEYLEYVQPGDTVSQGAK